MAEGRGHHKILKSVSIKNDRERTRREVEKFTFDAWSFFANAIFGFSKYPPLIHLSRAHCVVS